ncbi:hypothetical protein USDA257_c06660 [Sinorhizobium fredii USDA 257]|uniref:Uncharacterized protein n=1 Tax=Sinorhizobium fredii (strain USDA 257) TaxID=1185652 RepID=I3X054_SINF2|nr:hypothetical protein USDA257_c06660 [Sinorhizobium fredii USDA 257]
MRDLAIEENPKRCRNALLPRMGESPSGLPPAIFLNGAGAFFR